MKTLLAVVVVIVSALMLKLFVYKETPQDETRVQVVEESKVSGIQDQKLGPMTKRIKETPSRNTDFGTDISAAPVALYEIEEHGSAAYLNARDQVPELAKWYEVIQFEIIRIDQNALMQLVTNEDSTSLLDRKYSIPLPNGKSCDFAGRNYFELEPKKRIQVDGQCDELYGTFRGAYRVEKKQFSLIIKPYDQSAKFVIKTIENDMAVLLQVAHTPQPLKYH